MWFDGHFTNPGVVGKLNRQSRWLPSLLASTFQDLPNRCYMEGIGIKGFIHSDCQLLDTKVVQQSNQRSDSTAQIVTTLGSAFQQLADCRNRVV